MTRVDEYVEAARRVSDRLDGVDRDAGLEWCDSDEGQRLLALSERLWRGMSLKERRHARRRLGGSDGA